MPKIIPFGDRILVKRKEVGEKLGQEGIIVAPDTTKETKTDIAEVIHVPDHSFADKELIENAEDIINSHTKKAKEGDSEALIALLRFKEYLKIKSIKEGDSIMISKYVGVTFSDNSGGNDLTLVSADDVIGLVND